MKTYSILIVVVLVVFGGLWATNINTTGTPVEVVTTSITIGTTATINGTTIGVLELLEDSRCPVDVQCIQAGTVRVRASIDAMSRDFTFILNTPQVVGEKTLTLISVVPVEKYSQQTLQPSDYSFFFTVEPNKMLEGTACSMEVKLCSDGSSVGRSGPNCEFAECPPYNGPISLEARMGQEVSGLGVGITPLVVLQDSRCPSEVQCVWAGTVKIQARLSSGLGTALQEFTIGESITTEAETITLTTVSPSAKAGITIKESDYTFTFTITKRDPLI